MMTSKEIYTKLYSLQRSLKRADRLYHEEGGATDKNWEAVCNTRAAFEELANAHDIKFDIAACEAARRPIKKMSPVEKLKAQKGMLEIDTTDEFARYLMS